MVIDAARLVVRRILKAFNIGVTRYNVLQRLINTSQIYAEQGAAFEDAAFLRGISEDKIVRALHAMEHSKSQIRQDIFVLTQLNFKENGFFVEFGASNGIFGSNTYLLEKEYGWNGILAEPARCWHHDLKINRTSAIEEKCIWSTSNTTVMFSEAINPSLSGVSALVYDDWAKEIREISNNKYSVETITLSDLLKKYNAPKIVDYLSVDAEGSEFEILANFDFNAYQFRVITCEHNNTQMRDAIYDLLTARGYIRKFEELTRFEDWYIKVIDDVS